MSEILIATIAGLVTAFSWGTADWLAAKSTAKRLGPIEIDFVVALAGLVMAGVLFGVFDIHTPDGNQLARILTSSTLITTAYLLFVKALSGGIVGVIVPLGNSYPLVTVLLSVVILNEVFSAGQFSAMFGIVVGASFLAYEKNHKKIPFKELHRETALALGAALTWGLAFFILDPVTESMDWQTVVAYSYTFGFLLSVVLMALIHKSKAVAVAKKALKTRVTILAALAGNVGGIAFYLGSDAANSIIIPTVLSATGPLVASAWGAYIDHEKIGALKRAGAVLVVAGIIVLNVS